MSDLLGIGASGLRAYGRALATISDNIANAQTPGYARRSLALREMPTATTAPLLRVQVRPSGVEIAGVTRGVDPWLIAEDRLAQGGKARTDVRMEALSSVEGALADSDNGIATALTRLFGQADALTAEPKNQILRTQFLTSVDAVSAGFRGTAARLSQLAGHQLAAARNEVGQFNADLVALADVNRGLITAQDGSSGEATLLDQRDSLLDRLATRLDITVNFGPRGTSEVRAGSGDALLTGNEPRSLQVGTDPASGIVLSLDTMVIPAASGRLGGYIEAAKHIADQQLAIDFAAREIAAQLNAQHGLGRDQSGQAGAALFTHAGSASTIRSAALTSANVAAADAVSDNGNMLAFASLRGDGGPERLWSEILARQGQATADARAQQAAATSRHTASSATRSSVSAVDLDQEAADLIRFQQAYSAAAQSIRVARETLQTLFAII